MFLLQFHNHREDRENHLPVENQANIFVVPNFFSEISSLKLAQVLHQAGLHLLLCFIEELEPDGDPLFLRDIFLLLMCHLLHLSLPTVLNFFRYNISFCLIPILHLSLTGKLRNLNV